MSKTGAYKTTLVQVIIRECYHHTKNRGGDEESLIQAEDAYLNPITEKDIIYRETVHDWDDFKKVEVTNTEYQGEDYDD